MHTQTQQIPGSFFKPQYPNLSKALAGIQFPQDRSGICRFAENKGADDHVLSVIRHLPDYEYKTMADIIAASANPYAD